ncbi:hypothetical protein RI103_39445 (plasmid) [Paraburkholderia sp. FT54]|uniref:hypothetical protein n=1 Tax=Paraburkholderia sp. FT54 TaxID=3074437 RepID=UPI002877CE27|nr:hypothetical protein [Paraburkholderia sp. FT54]WNC95568.1 hypothetical protein RI103_39445 [Paraburkholderia sp. FT54]
MLPKTSKQLHGEQPEELGAEYPLAIALALQKDFGDSRRMIKTLERWTGASQRTVQNWLSAVRGPSGPHLVALAKHSSSVHFAYLALAERADPMTRNVDTALKLIREAIELLSGDD